MLCGLIARSTVVIRSVLHGDGVAGGECVNAGVVALADLFVVPGSGLAVAGHGGGGGAVGQIEAQLGVVMVGEQLDAQGSCLVIGGEVVFDGLAAAGVFESDAGAGFAGGIVSAAVDGIQTAIAALHHHAE